MPHERKLPLRRGEIIGERVGGEPKSEAEHFIKSRRHIQWKTGRNENEHSATQQAAEC